MDHVKVYFYLSTMALTKQQKNDSVKHGSEKVAESQSLIFAEFKGVTMEHFKALRRDLRKVGADLKIIKKRLLSIVLKNAGIPIDSIAMKNQLGTVFAKGDITSVAGILHKFSKQLIKEKKGEFTVLSAYDIPGKHLADAQEFKVIATLPSREILLAQIAMLLTMPVKKLLIALNERSKQVVNS